MTSMSPLLNEILADIERDERARRQPHRDEALAAERRRTREAPAIRGAIAGGLMRVALFFDAAAARRAAERRTVAGTEGF